MRSAWLTRRSSLWLGLAFLVALTCLVTLASLAIGSLDIAASVVLESFLGEPQGREEIIVQELRVPRTIIGLAAGAVFAMAGCLMQGLTRNPLADPGLLGVSAGAALAVLLARELVGVRDPSAYLWFAFLGAAVAGFLVYGLGSAGSGGASPIKLAIAGAALTAALTSVTLILLSLNPVSLDEMRFWFVGSIAGRPVTVFWSVAPFVVLGSITAILLGKPLNSLALGEEVAAALGVSIGRLRALAGATVIVLAGAGVAMAGPIAFLGLVVPHIARLIVGPDWRWILPYSLLIGAALLLAADILGRVIVRPDELQVGVVFALMGAPLFVALVRRRKLAYL